MFKKAASLVLLSLVVLFSNAKVLAQNTQNFDIKSFTADYYLSRNEELTSQLLVNETIVAEFPDFDQNHGILRAIPKSYQGHTVSLDVLSVTDEQGRPYPYSDSTDSGNLVLKIGDADKYVHGLVTYKISYTMKNVINFQTLDEFYWDVNGDQWNQTFDEVTARIHIPVDLASNLSADQECFAGRFQGTGQECQIAREDTNDETVITARTTRQLYISETLTFVIGFKSGTFKLGPEIAAEERRKKIIAAVIAGSIVTPIIGSIWFVVRRYRKYGRDPRGRGVVVPEYTAPKGFNAISSEAILKEMVTPKAYSAAILELAVKHYIVIYEIKKKKLFRDSTEFELELVKDPSDLPPELVRVVDALFADGNTIGSRSKLKDLKNKLYTELGTQNEKTMHDLFTKGYMRTDPKKTKSHYVKIGVIMIVASVAIGFLVLTIPFAIGLAVGGVIVILSASAMPSKSIAGVVARDHLKGLERYMKLAEKDRINFSHGLASAERIKADPQTAADKIKLFEKLLPYAMLFGIEKSWAKEFADLYKQAPDWYQGNVGTFNAAYLASSLGNFNTTSAAAFTSPSSSGSSGFGGGGFSGGGGGGGGGGGW